MRSALTVRSSPSRSGKRPSCSRAAPERASVQSPLRAALSDPVAGQSATAMRSPCFRDARHVQREAESTHRFHVVQHLAVLTPSRSRAFATQFASIAALLPAIEGKIEGAAPVGRKASRNQSGAAGLQFCARRRLIWKSLQVQGSLWHRAIEQPRQSDDCASQRAFGLFRLGALRSIIATMAFAIADRVD